ncbi:MAG: hypothetical protein ACREAE_08260, partial [Nitrosopumilaceae archaeon]
MFWKRARRSEVFTISAVIVASALLAISFSGNASAYTADDPAVKYHCFEKDEGGNHIVGEDGNLVPCRLDTGDNAWMMTSSALVLVMTPAGLAIFYSGLSRSKNAVNSVMMVFITTGII